MTTKKKSTKAKTPGPAKKSTKAATAKKSTKAKTPGPAKKSTKAATAKKSTKAATAKKSEVVTLSPSKMKRFMQCPGSIEFRGGGRPTKNRFADEFGTLAHQVFHDVLQTWEVHGYKDEFPVIWERIENAVAPAFTLKDRNLFEQRKDDLKDWSEQVFNAIRLDYEFLCSASKKEKVLLFLELKTKEIHVTTSKGKLFRNQGTADAVLCAGQTVYVYDFKTGMLEVDAEHNAQLQNYAHLFNQEATFADCEFTGVIIQPALNTISRAEIPILPDYFDAVQKSLEKVYNSDKGAALHTGQECRYCEYSEVCPAFRKRLDEFLKPTFHGEEMQRVEAWQEILEFVGPTIKALESIRSNALETAREGIEIPGFEVYYKPAQRRWIHNVPAASFAKMLKLKKSDVVKETLETPAQIEKKLKTDGQRDLFGRMVAQPSYPSLKYVGDREGEAGL
jgi:CRISPR/Cas system-associated exonuclease Cas4 (RecB family)